jgi:hypothetical protein
LFIIGLAITVFLVYGAYCSIRTWHVVNDISLLPALQIAKAKNDAQIIISRGFPIEDDADELIGVLNGYSNDEEATTLARKLKEVKAGAYKGEDISQ